MFSPTVSSSSSIFLRLLSASSALKGLFGGLLKLLHVLTDSLELLLNLLEVAFSEFGSLQSSLEFSFLNTELTAEFIKLLLVVNGHLDGGSEIFIELFNGDLIVQAVVFNDLDSFENVISGLGSEGQLGDGGAKSVSSLLVLFLHQHDPTGESGDIAFNLFVLFVSLLERLTGLGELVIGLIVANFKVLDFLSVVSDVAISLICASCCFLGGVLKATDGSIKTIGFTFK